MPLNVDSVKKKFEKPFVIGVGGLATSGKDTFYSLLSSYLAQYGIPSRRFALADLLKEEIDPYLQSQFGISAWTSNPNEKKLIRPCLVAHGFIRRQTSKGTYWTSKLETSIKNAIEQGVVPVVTDIRYAEFQEDELSWLTKLGGKFVHVSRYTEVGGTKVFIAPPNADEERNNPKLRDAANFKIEWRTENNVDALIPHIENFIGVL